MSELKLGQIITSPATRDAVHIAVTPVSSDQFLRPGERVALMGGDMDKVESCGPYPPIGIVDPFLAGPVAPGQIFWLFLFPGTITSLRHDWTHPAFETSEDLTAKAESEQWLRNFCSEHHGLNYYDMIEQLQVEGGYTVQQGSESARDEGISDEFKYHFRIVTGSNVLGHFSCSC